MTKISSLFACVVAFGVLSGCASVNMASYSEDAEKKQFSPPPQDMSAIYIYRDGYLGGALKKDIKIDGKLIGETAPMTYFYSVVTPGEHTIATESEFSDNEIVLNAVAGQNHFIEQYIKMGAFVGGANLKISSESAGKAGVLKTKLATSHN